MSAGDHASVFPNLSWGKRGLAAGQPWSLPALSRKNSDEEVKGKTEKYVEKEKYLWRDTRAN